jgi:hypothetical protein
MELVDEENVPFSAKDLIRFILYPTSKTLYQAEQVGFLRLLRGYSQAATMDEMVAFFFSYLLINLG